LEPNKRLQERDRKREIESERERGGGGRECYKNEKKAKSSVT